MNKKEIWVGIPDFNLYEVSNTGKIRSKDRIQRNRNGNYTKKGTILKPQDNGKGYLRVQLKQDGRVSRQYVHRLVAMAFIENKECKPCINHIDNNPYNNNVENLEWCTHQENIDWMNEQGRAKRTNTWIENLHKAQMSAYKPVIGINIETGEVIRFEKLNDVALKGFQPSCVSNCCHKRRGIKQHKGYRWEYEQIV